MGRGDEPAGQSLSVLRGENLDQGRQAVQVRDLHGVVGNVTAMTKGKRGRLEGAPEIESRELLRRAAVSCLRKWGDPDNGHCRACHGFWGRCSEGCPMKLTRAALTANPPQGCITPTGRADCHGTYVFGKNGKLFCSFCRKPLRDAGVETRKERK